MRLVYKIEMYNYDAPNNTYTSPSAASKEETRNYVTKYLGRAAFGCNFYPTNGPIFRLPFYDVHLLLGYANTSWFHLWNWGIKTKTVAVAAVAVTNSSARCVHQRFFLVPVVPIYSRCKYLLINGQYNFILFVYYIFMFSKYEIVHYYICYCYYIYHQHSALTI